MTGSKYMLASYQTEGDTRTVSSPSAVTPDRSTTASTSSSTTPINVYLYAGDQIIENVTMGYFYYQDSLGNTSHVTDAAGNLLERYTYSAFGIPTFLPPNSNTARSTSAFGIRHLFQGQLWTQETGLNDYRNRVGLPTMGVFLQPDPIGLQTEGAKLSTAQKALYSPGGVAPEAFTTTEMNLYRYCHNDPINNTDPTGLVDQSYTPDDTKNAVAQLWEKSYNPSDRFTLSAHANKDFYAGPDGKPLSIKKMADDIIKKGFDGSKPIESIACESGRGPNSPASQLQKELSDRLKKDVVIRAPTTDVGNGDRLGKPPVLMTEKDPKHPNSTDPKHYKPNTPENEGRWKEIKK
jgi:RHS repeat-associated protein